MKILGIESSAKAAGVALWEDGVVAEYTLNHALTHSQTLLTMVERALADCGWQMSDIDLYAVNVGPGSFTGVRIGVCAANAMAAAEEKPVAGVDSLCVLYHGVCTYPGPVCAIIDAKNANGYAALFENGTCILPPQPVEIASFCQNIPANTLLVGDASLVYRDMFEDKLEKPVFAPAQFQYCRAGALCAAAGTMSGTTEAAPLYLRPSQAERLFEEREKKKHG